MSITREVKTKCPKCNCDMDVKLWDSVDALYHPEEKDKVMKNELFKVKCEKCGSEINLEYPCRYEDKDLHLTVYLIPGFNDNHLKELNEDLASIELPKMMEQTKYRVVGNSDELVEKIIIFSNHKQDRPVELCKRKALKDIKEKYPDAEPTAIMYNHDKKGEYFSFLGCTDETGEMLTEPFDVDIYKSFDFELVNRDNYKEGRYVVVDGDWAKSLMK